MFKKIISIIILIPIIAVIALIASGNSYLLTGIQRTYLQGHYTANINDYTAFKTKQIATSEPALLPNANDYNQQPLQAKLLSHFENFGTAAYLVVEDGQVISEHYFNGYDKRSKTNSFSMAKTVTTLLLGIAIEEGIIDSLEQKITDFLPEFSNDPLGKNATIGQLSTMTSGYEWIEHYYSPFSPTVELLYGSDVEDFLLKRHFSAQPGSFFEYSSASTQLLGIILTRALQAQEKPLTLSQYLSKKIWQPLQMNDDALWHTDDKGMELNYCCISTNARNYAKLGMLMINNGQWNNRQLVSADFIATMTKPVAAPYYGYSTWINTTANPSYYWFSGHLGQYIIVIPDKRLVVVRLGETRESDTDFQLNEIPALIEQALLISNN